MGIAHISPDGPTSPASPAHVLVGRAGESETLCDRLVTDQASTGTAACIWGQGGIGKTALAFHVARRLVGDYPGGAIYVDLRGSTLSPLSAHEALARLLYALEPEAEQCSDLDELGAQVRLLLRDRRSILILDDAAHANQVELLLPPPGNAALITARKVLAWSSDGEGDPEPDAPYSLALASLRHQDARALLARFAPHDGAELEPLLHVCRGVPLALCLVGSALASESDLDLDDYVRELRETQSGLPPVEAVLRVSLSLAPTERQAQWRALSLLHGFDAAVAATVWDVPRAVAAERLDDLAARRLIEPSPVATEPHRRYRMHEALRAYALSAMEERERACAHMRIATHYVEVLRRAARLCAHEGEDLRAGLALLDLEWDNVHDGQAWAAQSLVESREAGQLCSAYSDVGGRCLEWRAPLKTQVRWLYDAVRAAREWVKPDAEIRHLGRLAALYQCQGKVDQAIAHYREALSVARQVKNLPAQSDILGNLGLIFSASGDHERAFGHFQQALNVAQDLGDRESEGNWVGNLGNAYSALGEIEQALRCHRQALEVARERGDRRREAIWLGNLGNSHMAMGEPQAAIEAYRQAIEIAREIEDRREQARMWGNLGNACCAQRDSQGALAAYESALQIARELADLGGEGIWLVNKCLVLDQQGRRSEAIACARDARDVLRRAGSAEVADVEALLERWQ